MSVFFGRLSSVLLLGAVVIGIWFDHVNNTASPAVNATLERVVDGDTIDVLINNKRVRVRLAGIDAPELSQPGGVDAQQFLTKMLGTQLKIDIDGQDKYGRALGTVLSADPLVSINEAMVSAGMAWSYLSSWLPWMQSRARSDKPGLWEDAGAIEPSQWRQAQQSQ